VGAGSTKMVAHTPMLSWARTKYTGVMGASVEVCKGRERRIPRGRCKVYTTESGGSHFAHDRERSGNV